MGAVVLRQSVLRKDTRITGLLKISHKLLPIFVMFTLTLFLLGSASAQSKKQIVRVAKLQIDPAKVDNYKAALKVQIEAAVHVEPGVITLYAVADKDNPTHITVFEIYADADAYKAHLESPHFKKYKNTTMNMVKSLELTEVDPIALESKRKK